MVLGLFHLAIFVNPPAFDIADAIVIEGVGVLSFGSAAEPKGAMHYFVLMIVTTQKLAFLVGINRLAPAPTS
jgi:hypothetical protein